MLTLCLLISIVATAAPTPKGPALAVPSIVVVTADSIVHSIDERGESEPILKLMHAGAKSIRLAPDRKSIVYAVRPNLKTQDLVIYSQALADKEPKSLTECQHLSALFWVEDGEGIVHSGLDIIKGNLPQNFRHQCWQSFYVARNPIRSTPYNLDGEYRLTGLTLDGKQFFAIRTFDPKPVGNGILAPQVETWLVDVKTQKKTLAISAEADVVPIAMLPGGNNWLVRKIDAIDRISRVGLLTITTSDFKALDGQVKTGLTHVVLSRDGKVIYAASDNSLLSFDFTGQNRKKRAVLTEVIREFDVR